MQRLVGRTRVVDPPPIGGHGGLTTPPRDEQQHDGECAPLRTRRRVVGAGASTRPLLHKEEGSPCRGERHAFGLQKVLILKACFRWSGEKWGCGGNATRLLRSCFAPCDRERAGVVAAIDFDACVRTLPGTAYITGAHAAQLRSTYAISAIHDAYAPRAERAVQPEVDYEAFVHDLVLGSASGRPSELPKAVHELRAKVRALMKTAPQGGQQKLARKIRNVIAGRSAPARVSEKWESKEVAEGAEGAVPLTGHTLRRELERECGVILSEHTVYTIGFDSVERAGPLWSMVRFSQACRGRAPIADHPDGGRGGWTVGMMRGTACEGLHARSYLPCASSSSASLPLLLPSLPSPLSPRPRRLTATVRWTSSRITH